MVNLKREHEWEMNRSKWLVVAYCIVVITVGAESATLFTRTHFQTTTIPFYLNIYLLLLK